MLIKTLQLGQLETNCYIVTDENTLECAVIDPGDESGTILNYLEKNHLKCKYVFITHGHYDHTMAVKPVTEATGATVCMNKKDSNATIGNAPFRFIPPEGTVFYSEGDAFKVGGLEFYVMENPRPHPRRGHSSLRRRPLHRRHPVCRFMRTNGFPRRRHGRAHALLKEDR